MNERLSSFDKRAFGRLLSRATAELPRAERFHLRVRYDSAPWERIVPFLAPRGDLVDIGSGPGLLAYLLGELAFEGTYVGLDPDERKVRRAKEWPGETETRRFDVGSVESAAVSAHDQAVIVDVLYLVPPEARGGFLARASDALRAGGRLVVVTSGGGPWWKRTLDRLQERAAVTLLGVTRGAAVATCDGAEIASLMTNVAGLRDVEVTSIGAGYLHGFEIVVGTRP